MVLSLMLIVFAETMNSAIESTVDRISLERRNRSLADGT
jgi:diacylglycerol kinase